MTRAAAERSPFSICRSLQMASATPPCSANGWIRRVYKTDGWPTTLMLVNTVGYLSEAAYHHPDLTVTWGRVIVKLQNHAAGGITDKDFDLARKIEDHVLWKPPQGGALEGTPNKWVRSGDPR